MVTKLPHAGAETRKGVAGRSCPICGKPAIHESRPFCSDRCKDVDLHRWLSGRYAIAGRDEDDSIGEARPVDDATRHDPDEPDRTD